MFFNIWGTIVGAHIAWAVFVNGNFIDFVVNGNNCENAHNTLSWEAGIVQVGALCTKKYFINGDIHLK